MRELVGAHGRALCTHPPQRSKLIHASKKDNHTNKQNREREGEGGRERERGRGEGVKMMKKLTSPSRDQERQTDAIMIHSALGPSGAFPYATLLSGV